MVGIQFNNNAQKHKRRITSMSKTVSRAREEEWLVFVGFEAVWAKKAQNIDLKRCYVTIRELYLLMQNNTPLIFPGFNIPV